MGIAEYTAPARSPLPPDRHESTELRRRDGVLLVRADQQLLARDAENLGDEHRVLRVGEAAAALDVREGTGGHADLLGDVFQAQARRACAQP